MQSIWPFLTISPMFTYASPPGVGDLKNVPTMGERTVKYLSSITSAVIAWALLFTGKAGIEVDNVSWILLGPYEVWVMTSLS